MLALYIYVFGDISPFIISKLNSCTCMKVFPILFASLLAAHTTRNMILSDQFIIINYVIMYKIITKCE